MKKRFLIFTHGGGRFANQLTNHGHWIAFHCEHSASFDVLNLGMSPYENLFDLEKGQHVQHVQALPKGLNRWKKLRQKLNKIAQPREYKMTFYNVVIRLLHLIYYLLPHAQSLKVGHGAAFLSYLPGTNVGMFGLGDNKCIELFNQKRVTLLAGWPVRNWELFRKHEDTIRKHLLFNKNFRRNAETCIKDIRTKHAVIVGVLIRQTDYRTWHGGNFFFETGEYFNWMKQVSEILSQDTAFVIASDEQQALKSFDGLPTYFSTGKSVGKNHFIESFVELSMCDYIITAPSTFGIWAAFLGDVPLIPVFKSGQTLKKSDFLKDHIYDSLDHKYLSIAMK